MTLRYIDAFENYGPADADLASRLKSLPPDQAAKMAIDAAMFAYSPISDIVTWVKTGAPPPRDELTRAGYGRGGDIFAISTTEQRAIRDTYVKLFGFALPCAEAIDALVALGPIVEVGAGSGYWSAILSSRGADVIATDIAEPGKGNSYGARVGMHFPIAQMPAADAIKRYRGRTILSCWPCKKSPWLADALVHTRTSQFVAIVGEYRHGVTGTSGLFDLLEEQFVDLGSVELPVFPGLCDRLYLYRRRDHTLATPKGKLPG
jgi:hypothetical protein